jgi:hypothetical protein
MAITKVAKQVAKLNNVTNLTFTTVSTPADGFALDFTGADNKCVAVFSGTGTVTLKHGDGIQGVADANTVTVDGVAVVRLDAGRFKNTSGANKDYVVAIPSANTLKAAVVELGTQE